MTHRPKIQALVDVHTGASASDCPVRRRFGNHAGVTLPSAIFLLAFALPGCSDSAGLPVGPEPVANSEVETVEKAAGGQLARSLEEDGPGSLSREELQGLSRRELETRLLAISKVNEDLRRELAASRRARARIAAGLARNGPDSPTTAERSADRPEPDATDSTFDGSSGPGSGRPIVTRLAEDDVSENEAVRSAVESWARAWQDQRVEDYLDIYSARFRPRDTGRSDWVAQRRLRILSPSSIEVTISDLRISVVDAQARTRFRQSYRADHYSDVVDKRLVFELENGNWKIVEETSLGQVE